MKIFFSFLQKVHGLISDATKDQHYYHGDAEDRHGFKIEQTSLLGEHELFTEVFGSKDETGLLQVGKLKQVFKKLGMEDLSLLEDLEV